MGPEGEAHLTQDYTRSAASLPVTARGAVGTEVNDLTLCRHRQCVRWVKPQISLCCSSRLSHPALSTTPAVSAVPSLMQGLCSLRHIPELVCDTRDRPALPREVVLVKVGGRPTTLAEGQGGKQ